MLACARVSACIVMRARVCLSRPLRLVLRLFYGIGGVIVHKIGVCLKSALKSIVGHSMFLSQREKEKRGVVSLAPLSVVLSSYSEQLLSFGQLLFGGQRHSVAEHRSRCFH